MSTEPITEVEPFPWHPFETSKRMVVMTIQGKLVSMKNSKIHTMIKGRPFAIKSHEARKYERDFRVQVPSEYRGLQLGALDKPLATIVRVFYPSRRSDLDASLVYDMLQHTGVIANDRYITAKIELSFVDKVNPRVEIEVREME